MRGGVGRVLDLAITATVISGAPAWGTAARTSPPSVSTLHQSPPPPPPPPPPSPPLQPPAWRALGGAGAVPGCAGGPAWTATATPPAWRCPTAARIFPQSAGLPSPAVAAVVNQQARLITVTATPSVGSWEIVVRTSTSPAGLNTPAETAVSLSPLSPRPDSFSPVRELARPPVTVTRTVLRSETAVQTMKNSVKQSRRPLSILAKGAARIKRSLCGDFQNGKVADYKEILKFFTWSIINISNCLLYFNL